MKMEKITVMLVDDHQMVRLGLSSYLNMQDDLAVVAEAVNGLDGVQKAKQHRPDVILMDLVMDEMDGIEASKAILLENPEAKILILTSFLDDEKIFPALAAGVKGYILKTSQANEIAASVRKIAEGQDVISDSVRAKIYEKKHAQPELHEELTARESEVLKEIAKGLSNQEIADELYISLKTVKTHVSNILSKLQVEDRTQAAIYAIKHKIA
jgi:two-component system, NarL family, response regulator LiaR